MPTIPFLHESSEKRERRGHPPQDLMTTIAGQNNKNPGIQRCWGNEISLNKPFAIFDLTSKTIQQVGSDEPKRTYIAAIQVGELWSIGCGHFNVFHFLGNPENVFLFSDILNFQYGWKHHLALVRSLLFEALFCIDLPSTRPDSRRRTLKICV